ncbi:MAG: aminopeptidase P family protein [Pseudomonadota bacterium]
MFQSFEVKASADKGRERLQLLRSKFDDNGIDCFLVPRADRFQGEYVPDCEARLAWLTGFTGSAGTAVIFRDDAHVFVDGRYTSQLRQQVDLEVFTPEDLVKTPPRTWLAKNAPKGLRIGVDPWLHTVAGIRALDEAAAKFEASVIKLDANPIDAVWKDRPAEPLGRVTVQPEEFAGRTAVEKLEDVYAAMTEQKADAWIVTDPSSVAWLFNIRGSDVAHTPHPLAHAIIMPDGENALFIDRRKLDSQAQSHLSELAALREPDQLETVVSELGKGGAAILIDPNLAPARIGDMIAESGAKAIEETDPSRLQRARKNAVELKGSRAAHLRDGAAMVRFLAWLDDQQPGSVDEIAAVKALEQARRDTGERLQMPLKDIAFETISGAGHHGAIVHYRVTTQTNRLLSPGELYLVDSGGQYQDGTTDITRTVPIGSVGADEKRFFTLVLKGMISLTLQRFPKGTRGVEVDVVARSALWNAGADYAHGTGHGVGSYLSVHEGPQSISRRGMQELLPGMICSNEPGYYREGAFGIRIENLVVVTEAEPVEGGDTPMLGFDTLTRCPIDRRLVVTGLLDPAELSWLNDYHADVRRVLTPLLDNQSAKDWLEAATEPISPD